MRGCRRRSLLLRRVCRRGLRRGVVFYCIGGGEGERRVVIWGWRNIGVLGGYSVRSFFLGDCSAELIGIYFPPLLVCPFSFSCSGW